jgi:hypothetical protein
VLYTGAADTLLADPDMARLFFGASAAPAANRPSVP